MFFICYIRRRRDEAHGPARLSVRPSVGICDGLIAWERANQSEAKWEVEALTLSAISLHAPI